MVERMFIILVGILLSCKKGKYTPTIQSKSTDCDCYETHHSIDTIHTDTSNYNTIWIWNHTYNTEVKKDSCSKNTGEWIFINSSHSYIVKCN